MVEDVGFRTASGASTAETIGESLGPEIKP